MKIPNWIKVLLKVLVGIGAILGAIFLGKKIVQGVESIFGIVQKPSNWEPVPGDPTKVIVAAPDGSSKVVALPVNPTTKKQVTSDNVAAVGLSNAGQWTVQTKAENVFGG